MNSENALLVPPNKMVEITDYKRPKDQIRWLVDNGWKFGIGASGKPKVTIAEMHKRMTSGKVAENDAQSEPNFDWMSRRSA